MRQVAVSVLFIGSACSGVAAPPVPPGEIDPPCELGPARSFLIDAITLPVDPDENAVDLDVPPNDDGNDRLSPFFEYLQNGAGSLMSDGVSRALSARDLLWVVTTETCADSATSYARVAWRRGTTATEDGGGLIVEVEPGALWGVGEVDEDGAVLARQGRAMVPLSVLVDSRPEAAPVQWVDATTVSTTVIASSEDSINGVVGFAADPEEFHAAVAEGVSRTVTDVASSDAGCPDTCDGEWARLFLDLFDLVRDGVVTPSEVLDSGNLSRLGLQPSADVLASFEGEMVIWPGHDHERDSVGGGAYFHAVSVEIVQ
jgi:hypothetical protein